MKVQILVRDQIIDTQIISTEPMMVKPSVNELKRLALKASLEDKKIRISEFMVATFRVFDVFGNPTED